MCVYVCVGGGGGGGGGGFMHPALFASFIKYLHPLMNASAVLHLRAMS